MTAQIGNRSRDLKAAAATYPKVGRGRFTVVALPDPCFIGGPVKVVKQQINGGDRLVLKENALASDLKTEAMRLKAQGVDVVDLGAGEPDFGQHQAQAQGGGVVQSRIAKRAGSPY